MKVQLNEVIRAGQASEMPITQIRDKDDFINFYYLLSNGGQYKAGNIQRPMFHHAILDKEGQPFYPGIYFHSNPLKKDRKVKPWVDILLPDEGYVYYNGDNQTPGLKPEGKILSGNRTMEKIWTQYTSKDKVERERASPIFIFEQVMINGKKQGYREFRGYGIITNVEIRQEFEPSSNKVFSNYMFEISLFRVPPEGLDWSWIYDRRNKNLSLNEVNKRAPPAWREWIKKGHSAIKKSRQKISHYEISKPKEQVEELGDSHKSILNSIAAYYKKSTEKGKFEALASLVAQEYFGKNYDRGWITPLSGDMGVDFIGRLDITNNHVPNPAGTVLGHTKLLVIGQAKCRTNYDSHKGENARDIARVSSRLQRGYLGIYITTGTFTEATQKEVSIDGYPIILINGRQLADLLIQYKSKTGLSMNQILKECDEWYEHNQRNIPPSHILRHSKGVDIDINGGLLNNEEE